MAKVMGEGSRVAWEPGDDICPPWPWYWHRPGPPPPWWDEKLIDSGREIFVGLTLVNLASKMSDPGQALRVAKVGAELISTRGEQVSRAVGGS
jgi:hypothetical protein